MTVPGTGRFEQLPLLPDDRLLPGRPLLLVIDMQYDFMERTAPCYNLGAEHTVEPTARLIDAFRQQGLPIIFTREVHRPGRVDAGLEADPHYGTPAHTVEGTRGVEIVAPLAPLPGELVVDKRRYNCFLGTELELLLRLDPVDTLVIVGVSSDICVHWTAGEAFQRDYHVRVVEDCTAGTSLADHEASLLILRNLCSGGRTVTSDDVLGVVLGAATVDAGARA
jgi:nicotinamidase-related amidase